MAMVHLAESLGKQTIAEFVENAETLEILRSIGVDCAQGFHIGRPRPLEDVLTELRAS
jgi:EAL domain-containing protein (putative c-di-GMP-specific phosphodiesterase class I)